MIFSFFIKTNPHHEGQHAHQQYEVKDGFLPGAQAHTWKSSCCTGDVIFLYFRFFFLTSMSGCFSAGVSSASFDGGMLSRCFCSWIPGSRYAAFMRWFPTRRGGSVTKASERQTGLNFLKPLGGCCCHFSVQQLISQTNQCWHCCQSARSACWISVNARLECSSRSSEQITMFTI